MTTIKDINNVIVETINNATKEDQLSEAFVAVPKEFDLSTELLSAQNKLLHKKLYNSYIEKFNRVSAELDTVNKSDVQNKHSTFRSLKIDEAFLRNAIYLHELYFANISDVKSQITYDSIAHMRLSRDFGTFDNWQYDLIACANAARSGWVVTAFDTFLKRYTNFVVDEHSLHAIIGCYPVMVIDVWEHAYYKDYGVNVDDYVKNMMREINWDVVERRIEKAEMLNKVIK